MTEGDQSRVYDRKVNGDEKRRPLRVEPVARMVATESRQHAIHDFLANADLMHSKRWARTPRQRSAVHEITEHRNPTFAHLQITLAAGP
jgi:hypothetical protein